MTKYCITCKYEDREGTQQPCKWCLEEYCEIKKKDPKNVRFNHWREKE